MTTCTHAVPPADAAAARPLSLAPLLFSALATSMAMMAFVSLTGPIARTVHMPAWQAGLAVTIGGVMWMLMSRPWGVASDRRGRATMLLAATGGFALSYWAMCAVLITSLHVLPAAVVVFAGLVVTRAGIGACFAGVLPISQALVADQVPPERRAGAMAGLGAAMSLGMTLGPALAALLGQVSLSTPLYVTALLPMLGVAGLWFTLPRHHAPVQGATARPVVKVADRRLRQPMVVMLVTMICLQMAQISIGFFAIDRIGLEAGPAARAAGIALTAVGVAMTGSQLLMRQLHWPATRFVQVGAVVAAAGYGATAWVHSEVLLGLCYFVGGLGMGWLWPAIGTLAANAVGPHEQGAAAGTVGTAHGLGLIVGPVAGTALYSVAPPAPFIAIIVLMCGVFAWVRRSAPA